ncbi:hypothetical protein CNEO2_350013 [Clostridium neonatale]|nr:hypothetical protein CNEO2_350013 [Clostridium neonatale]
MLKFKKHINKNLFYIKKKYNKNIENNIIKQYFYIILVI